MKTLFIGPYSEGSTSKMRGECIKKDPRINSFQVIDPTVPFATGHRILKSVAWRYRMGPLIGKINTYVEEQLQPTYHMVWIDKGVMLTPRVVNRLRSSTDIMVHFTPDPAFYFHKSHLFNKAVPLYDVCVTTKSYEVDRYTSAGAKRVILTTQGFDKNLHKSYHTFEQKEGIIFIGHFEKERAEIIQLLIDANIEVKIAGIKWEKFAQKNQGNEYLTYYGKGIYGPDYAKEISKAKMGLGLMSKWIPELHTTRTFEIPACGTALVTERNGETQAFFENDAAIFFSSAEELVEKILYYNQHNEELSAISSLGKKTVIEDKYDYDSIIQDLLAKIID